MHPSIHTLQHWLDQYGYLVIFLSLVVEYLVFLVPGETFLVLAGAYASTGRLNLGVVMLAAALGAAIGSTNAYVLGRWGGQAFLDRYAQRLHISPRQLERMQRFFRRHGDKTVFLARFVTVVRILVGYFAGAHRMPFGRFTLYNVLGASAWAVLVAALGYAFASNLGLLRRILTDFGIVALVAVALVLYFLFLRRESRESRE